MRVLYVFERKHLGESDCPISRILNGEPTIKVKDGVTLLKRGGTYVLLDEDMANYRCVVSADECTKTGTIKVVVRWLE